MAAVTICSDFGVSQKSQPLFPLFPHLFAMKWWDQMPWSLFSECGALSQHFYSPLSLSSGGFLVLLHFLPYGWCHLHIWGYWDFSWQSWFQLAFPPAQRFSWCTLHISKTSRVTIYSLVLLFLFRKQICLHLALNS